MSLRLPEVPEPSARGLCAIARSLRARVTVEPGSPGLAVVAAAGEHTGQLEVIVLRHGASGSVREIARKDEDQPIEAAFDPETGVVTVYEGRREFRELERAARRGGYTKKRVAEYVPSRMLAVEAAANGSTRGLPSRSWPAGIPRNGRPTLRSTPRPPTTRHRRCGTALTTS